ncbi:hypothetical protein BO94DRAFT_535325 [Aspergillus sclerotioniger CBS 115572]|uniref:Uncharacterized protein n=1 Tax=Aspergillus sclerotioniger CBS 115572 TaxID=1450535 RepID=A0A317WQ12_9EURO|nr:hypothetical protein BO94DRAFT_535325 [Aspergillus sclerotioniger CBS 115572]PWY87217.1 hypothetical protein BO94DRAFT_535325 [Aspergillus sclerotioniger CBS 115572]
MGNPMLYVAFYRPREGNYQHWALYINDGNDSIIFEVTGCHPDFKPHVIDARPQSSKSYLGSLELATLRDDDIEYIKEAAKEVKVDIETVEWDCQD